MGTIQTSTRAGMRKKRRRRRSGAGLGGEIEKMGMSRVW